MKFWRLEEPEYESDYHQIYINGGLEHAFGLPGVQCDVCDQTWGGSRILPYECPMDLRAHKNLTERWPIPLQEHKCLQQEVLTRLKAAGAPVSELRPDDDFQPCYLDVPSKPRADFLWASLGSLVVAERMKDLLMQYCADDIAVCRAHLRKIDKRDAKLPPPIPSTGEPADMIEEVPSASCVSDVGPYFEVCILKESGLPPGGEPVKVCPGCGRAEINESKREIRMLDHMWKGNQIFFLATTLYILVTDDLKKIIEKERPTNVVFAEIWQDEDPGLLKTTPGGRNRTERR